MKIATICLMVLMTVTLMLMSLVLLQQLRSDDSPVGKTSDCNTMNYRWEMGRIVKDC